MKKICLISFFLLHFVSSCKKGTNLAGEIPMSSITIVNGSTSYDALLADFTGSSPFVFFTSSPAIGSGSYNEFNVSSGNRKLAIFNKKDTTSPIFSSTMSLEPSQIYTLILYNPDGKGTDTLMTRDNIPYHSDKDSVVGIRFINALGSNRSVSVNVEGMPSGSSVSRLDDRGVSDFILLPANADLVEYDFEIRDIGTSNIVATYSCPISLFQNCTIILTSPDFGSGLYGINPIQVNNF